MTKIHPYNERLKRDYLILLKQARGKAEITIDAIRKALNRFDDYNKHKDYKLFRREQAIGFKAHLSETKRLKTGEALSLSTQLSTLKNIKEFFLWLHSQKEYRNKIKLDDIEYFNLTDKEISIAKADKPIHFPNLEQIRHVIHSMPIETPLERRNRALIALTALTGIRDNALASLKLSHLDLSQNPPLIYQNPKDVRTKFSKAIFTYFLPIDESFTTIIVEWVKELKTQHLFSMHDPLFPKTLMGMNEQNSFAIKGLSKAHWANASPIRTIFKEAFEAAGLPYFNPHFFRHTLGHLAQTMCKTGEELKAWSQNLGHENVQTTLTSYGKIDAKRQGEVIGKIGMTNDNESLKEKIMALITS